MFFSVSLLLNSKQQPRLILTTTINIKLINDIESFLQAIYILKGNKKLKKLKLRTITSYFLIQDIK